MGRGGQALTQIKPRGSSLRNNSSVLPNTILKVKTPKDLKEFLTANPDPYEGIAESDYSRVSEIMWNAFPLNEQRLINGIENYYQALMREKIMRKKLEELEPGNRFCATLMHEGVVEQIAKQRNFVEGTHTINEHDVTHRQDKIFGIEVKTGQKKTGITANKSYGQKSSKEDRETTNKKSQECFYIAVNYVPPRSKGEATPIKSRKIHRIGFAFLTPEDFNSDSLAENVQAASLQKSSANKFFDFYKS